MKTMPWKTRTSEAGLDIPSTMLGAVSIVLAAAILLSACGSDDEVAPDTPPAPTQTVVPSPVDNGPGESWPEVRSYCDPAGSSARIFVASNGEMSVVPDDDCWG